ncbi:MAG TPA: site-specific integrase [Nitrososphaeraceae archaeon]|nr:site-specific integrase [Nitrososphaeraceae archaeon]
MSTAVITTKLQINSKSESIAKFIKSVSIRNKSTAKQYYSRLLFFERFVQQEQYNNKKISIDNLVKKLKNGELDPYDVLNDYCLFLKNNYNNIGSVTFRDKITTVKTFLEYNDIEISPRKFKLKVRFPKTVLRHKEAIDKEDIIKILNGCSDLRLKTYVMLLASTGLRATEALSIRLKDFDTNNNDNPTKLIIRGEFTKTKVDRYVFLTKEVQNQIKIWLDYKYRTRRICYKDKRTGKTVTEYRTPEKNPDELVFSLYHVNKPSPEVLYDNLTGIFAKTLDRIGMGSREDENENRRRKITLHSMRRFVKTTISDLGYSDYSEWFIGHSGSTYWRKKDSEKAEIFKKIEPYLTFLNVPQLERQGADLQTKIEELQDINQLLRYKQNEKEEQIKKLEESVAFLADKFNAFLASQPGNTILYDNDEQTDVIKGIELKPELNNKAVGTVISTSTNNRSNKIK